MVDSRTPETAEPSTPTADVPPRVGVAYSGGRDSTALLWACLKAARPLGVEVLACHVHHGLLPQADDWWVQAQDRCDAWAAQGWPVRFCGVRLSDAPTPGESVEAWARQARYAALEALAEREGLSLILLGHHQQDQAETVLIQLLRGAGPAGLAAMPASREGPGGLTWARPWLSVNPTEIQSYATSQGLSWVEDPSNRDTRFARNRIRHQVLSTLIDACPTAVADLARSARAQAEAQAVLSEVARDDLARCRLPGSANRLDVRALAALSPARCRLVLRAWGQSLPCGHFPESLLDRLAPALHHTGRGGRRWPSPGGSELRLHRGQLIWFPAQKEAFTSFKPERSGAIRRVDFDTALPPSMAEPGEHRIPGWAGVWRVAPLDGPEESSVSSDRPIHTLPLSRLAGAIQRARQGNDRFQRHPSGMPRSLKKCFQDAGLPAWERHGPVLDLGGGLLFVPGLGLDARLWHVCDKAAAGVSRELWCSLTWLPDQRPGTSAAESTSGEASGSP